jgi:hypothetical protein
MWQSIIEELGVLSIIGGLITFLFHSLSKHLFSKRMTEFESEIKLRIDREISLHQKRLAAIEDVYEKVVAFERIVIRIRSQAGVDYQNIASVPNKDIEQFITNFENLKQAIELRRIFFKKETYNILSKIISIGNKVVSLSLMGEFIPLDKEGIEITRSELDQTFYFELPESKDALVAEFHSIMGVDK